MNGVIQGSVIGPLLFLLFINNVIMMVTKTGCTCQLYADDLKLYTTVNVDNDRKERLNDLSAWSNAWQKKCTSMLIGTAGRETEARR